MDGRERIMRALAGRGIEECEHPGHRGPWVRCEDRQSALLEQLAGAGGEHRRVSRAQLRDAFDRRARELSARVVCSAVEGVPSRLFDARSAGEKECAGIDLTVVEGSFGVAENGAIWVSGERLVRRASLFLCRHVAVVLEAASIVHSMHEAYERLRFPGPGYGCFVCGPSKTADIEQSLVIGAHGPCTLTLFLIDPVSTAGAVGG